jgi:hypothetical protein
MHTYKPQNNKLYTKLTTSSFALPCIITDCTNLATPKKNADVPPVYNEVFLIKIVVIKE